MKTQHRVSERLLHYRTLLVIIAITALVWLVWAMSDVQTYPTQVRVEMTGVDKARYAIIKADTMLSIEVESDGFSAMRRYFKLKRHNVRVDMSHAVVSAGHRAVAVHDFIPTLKKQLGLPTSLRVTSGQDSIRLWLAARHSRGFVPKLKDVSFEFTDQCGVYGEPTIYPDTVWLYGSEASLAKIDELYTKPAVVEHISKDDTVRLALEPVWEKYSDLRVSTKRIQLRIPTQQYTEKTFTLPIQLLNGDTNLRVKLYPEQVDVTIWVPIKDHAKISANQLSASIELHKYEDRAQVMIKDFPSYVRVKNIKPEYVQYVIIK